MPVVPRQPLDSHRRAIVVGASSGIGAALAEAMAQRGYLVAAVARRADELAALAARQAHIYPYAQDVTAFAATEALFQRIVRDLDGLDVIVYAAGVQPSVGAQEYTFDKDQAMVEVNLLGAMAWLNLAALRFSRARAGQIVGISSIAGDRGRAAFPGYHASKAGLSTYLESLRNRLTRQGVTVTTIKPGFVETRLLANASRTFWVISAETAAQHILRAIEQRRQTVYVPGRWRWVSLIIQHLPSAILRRLNV